MAPIATKPDPPAAVKAATATYEEESDPLGDFLSTSCIEVKAAAAYVEYKSWADDESIRCRDVMSSKTFGVRMTARFVKQKRKTVLTGRTSVLMTIASCAPR